MRVWLTWWTACLLWSGTFLFIKLGVAVGEAAAGVGASAHRHRDSVPQRTPHPRANRTRRRRPLAAPWSAASIVAVLYLALGGSVLAFWLNYYLLNRIDASAMLMMGMAEVPIAMALGAAS